MRVAFCTNIPPVRDAAGLRGRNQAIIDRVIEDGHAVEVIYGPEALLHGEAPPHDIGLLCPNDLVAPVPDPAGRLAADTVALALEADGVPFVNSPLARRYCTNKLVAHIAFRSAGIPQPATWTVDEADDLRWPPAGLVAKPIGGSCGLGIRVVGSATEARAHAQRVGEPCFLQEVVPRPRCVRVVASQDRAVACYEKRVAAGEFVAAVSANARELRLAHRADIDSLAVAMVRAVGVDIGGVDILESADGRLYALEVNVNFGFYPRSREILDALMEMLLLRANRLPTEA